MSVPHTAASGQNAAMSRARILVIEDDDAIRTALDAALSAENYEVRAQPDGSKAEQVALLEAGSSAGHGAAPTRSGIGELAHR